MDVSKILDPLNNAQRQAVTATAPHVLVLAGAGSGKTRVLTHRIAWLLQTQQARPHQILAVTFTNKAAQEMHSRINQLVEATDGLWSGTFHGIAHRLLRIHWEKAQLPQAFMILDSDDQLRLIKRLLKAMELSDKTWQPRSVQSFIGKHKDNGERAKDVPCSEDDDYQKTLVNIYLQYEQACERAGVVDFAELLLRVYELLQREADILQQYQQRFRVLLVDEFQDTNALQYNLLRLLTGERGQLFIVGDDDQSIYGWRGARIENIQNFPKHFAETEVIKLEQNYRSSGTILAAANALISHNSERLGKELWTDDKPGEPIYFYTAYSENDEAEFIVSRIEESDEKRSEMAILYRTSAQSRLFEESLIARGIPYRIYGGMRFYERAEIKDLLAYLRLVRHPDDDSSFERVINTPKRGLGERSVENLRKAARQYGVSLSQAAQRLIESGEVKGRTGKNLQQFFTLLDNWRNHSMNVPLHDLINDIVNESGLLEHYQKEGKEEGLRRKENLEELVKAAREFVLRKSGDEPPLDAFLAHAALEAGIGQGSAHEDCVQLMTLHLAKGLEFNTVFLCGLEEGLFPHKNAIEEGKIEEERRICYVGITRARQCLYVTCSETRYRYGMRDFSTQSRFIKELPAELLEPVRLSSAAKSFVPDDIYAQASLDIGDRVRHQSLGEGVVIDMEGQGEFARVQVHFAEEGNHWLILSYAGLERM